MQTHAWKGRAMQSGEDPAMLVVCVCVKHLFFRHTLYLLNKTYDFPHSFDSLLCLTLKIQCVWVFALIWTCVLCLWIWSKHVFVAMNIYSLIANDLANLYICTFKGVSRWKNQHCLVRSMSLMSEPYIQHTMYSGAGAETLCFHYNQWKWLHQA